MGTPSTASQPSTPPYPPNYLTRQLTVESLDELPWKDCLDTRDAQADGHDRLTAGGIAAGISRIPDLL